MDSIGDRLRDVREKHGYTQEALAQRTGLGLATIRRIEQSKGKRETKLGTIETLAEALSVEPAWIAYGTKQMVSLRHMTQDEQIRAQPGKASKNLSGFVVLEGGPWERHKGEWRVFRIETPRP